MTRKRDPVKQKPEQKEFVDLIERSKKLIYKVCFMYGRTEDARQDLFQEIVMQIWRSFPGYDSTRKFSTWIYRIALNTAITFVRQESRNLEIETDERLIDLQVDARRVNPEATDCLNQIMAQLGEVDKAMLLLMLEDHSHAEIAEVLGISASNVGTRLHRVRQRFKGDGKA